MNVTDAHAGHGFAGVRWIGAADATALRRSAYLRVVGAAARAIERRGRFLIVLAGGNTPRGVYDLLCAAPTDWSCWQVYFGDERCLPPDDPDRNSRMAAGIWLEHVPIAQDQLHVIPAELGAEAAAQSYADTLRGVGDFDLVLLGLGEDGHTASLFPGHDWGVAPDAPDVLAVFDAPKPPPQRVSLSAARLSRAREVLFLVEGEAKRSAIARWRAGEQFPAGAIRLAGGVDVLVESALLGPGAL
jgi:6-phosphogluconolactonase